MASILTALLTMAFTGLLLYARIPLPVLILGCVGLGVFLTYFSSHSHSQTLSIDIMAQTSRLKDFNPTLKFWTLLSLLIICVASRGVITGVFLILTMLILSVFAGGLDLHHYLSVLVVPIRFLLIGGLALLLEVSTEPTGILSYNIFGIWLCVTRSAQIKTALLISRAFGAVSCLCLLSTTTPMPDIIAVLRRARCPDIIIDLMYLIYRYIFVLMNLHHEMYNAATSRLGFKDYRTSMRTTARIYSSLFARSFQLAGKNFDAMESRCYDTGISFLQRQNKITPVQVSLSAALVIVVVCLSLLPF